MLTLLVISMLAQTSETRIIRVERVQRVSGRALGGNTSALLEFAPASGAGMTVDCACTNVTTTTGAAVTTTRNSGAMCTRGVNGLRSTLIANGDLTECAANLPRVERDADGVAGVLVEPARANYILRSAEFDNVAWQSSSGAGAPTVTANAGVAPDGTTTADRLQVTACPTSGQYSAKFQVTTLTTPEVKMEAIYVRGTSTSASIGFISGSGSTYSGLVCNVVSTSYTRCIVPGVSGGTNSEGWVGCINQGVSVPAVPNTGAADVLVWGAQVEQGLSSSAQIPTTSAAVSRAADVVSIPVMTVAANISIAASIQPQAIVDGMTAFQLRRDGSNAVTGYINSSGQLVCDFTVGGVSNTVTSVATISAGVVSRVACQYSASSRRACVGGVCASTAGALMLATGASTFYPGSRSVTGNELGGIVSRSCVDDTGARCI